jgi:hypothetical protein
MPYLCRLVLASSIPVVICEVGTRLLIVTLIRLSAWSSSSGPKKKKLKKDFSWWVCSFSPFDNSTLYIRIDTIIWREIRTCAGTALFCNYKFYLFFFFVSKSSWCTNVFFVTPFCLSPPTHLLSFLYASCRFLQVIDTFFLTELTPPKYSIYVAKTFK